MENIINSFKAHLYERTTNPLIGAFIFYWIVCNYKLVMIIFDGDMKVNEKFDLIKLIYPEKNIWTPWEGFNIYYSILLGNGLLIPLIISLAYIFIVPYPAKLIYSFWKKNQKELIKIKNNIDDETPIGEEQSKKLRNAIYTLQKKHDSQFEEIINLKSLINSTDSLPHIKENSSDVQDKSSPKLEPKSDNTTNKEKNTSLTLEANRLTHKESSILEQIAKTDQCTAKEVIKVCTDHLDLEYYLDELLLKKLIEFDSKTKIIKLTKLAKKLLVQYREYNEIPF